MKKLLQKALVVFFLVVVSNCFCQTSKYLRKASAAVYNGHYEKARQYYLKALEKDPDSYKANWGVGIVMSEYLGSYENSLPYLEKALSLSPSKDSVSDVLFSLGKVYAYFKQYDNALNCFQKVLEYVDDNDEFLKRDLRKRISDCYYSKNHMDKSDFSTLYVVNAGKTINSEVDEYVPVLTPNNQLIFTAKRKDGLNEKINSDNGKYYEAMYIADLKNGYTSPATTYSNITKKSINTSEAIVSTFPDGQKIFLYIDNKLYEGTFDRKAKNATVLSSIMNIDDYQNHACLTKDGNTLYFTSESKSGFGGNDIYVSVKNADGTWGTPRNLGDVVNTTRDEEAPFVSTDGKTLYFSSNGHSDCYGEFDIYKTTVANDVWTPPVNLGLPINSTANDVFYVIKEDSSAAYFASSRPGGFGDLDIYKVNFPGKFHSDSEGTPLALEASPTNLNAYNYTIKMGVPQEMREKVISFNFSINDSLITNQVTDVNYQFKKPGDYKFKAKLVAVCDTCINPYVASFYGLVTVKDTTPIVAANTNNTTNNTANSNSVGNNTATSNNGVINNNTANNNTINNSNVNSNNNNGIVNNASQNTNNVFVEKGQLTEQELNDIGLNLKPLYFSFDDQSLRSDAKENLDYNIEILKKYPKLKIIVNGHTDSRGGPTRNLYLSDRRATTVRKYMIAAGVPKRRISQSAKGETQLINNCNDNVPCDNAMHQLNRRVELKVVK